MDIQRDKLAFKAMLQRRGLPTPAHSLSNSQILEPVIVKRQQQSADLKIRGPFHDNRQARTR